MVDSGLFPVMSFDGSIGTEVMSDGLFVLNGDLLFLCSVVILWIRPVGALARSVDESCACQ